ncbi:ion transporter [Halorientalis sp.]|jgi:voltage-gated potassium channel|uniref:ion transporter n=1 Tax=Halorientalis sp. TaxID=1931229 RepID=UPI0026187F72|nr:ion transporter [Halorientalis sp.]
MDGEAETQNGFRGTVQFYLLDHQTLPGKAIDVALLLLNLLFVCLFIVETYPVADGFRDLLWALEVLIATVFLVEYVLRLYGAQNRVAEFLNGYAMVDLFAILPTLLLVAFPASMFAVNVGFLRVLRIVRVFRFYRFTKDAEFFFGTVEDNTLRAMRLLLTILVLLSASAGLFYSAEQAVNPGVDTFGDAFYYTVVALSTVGFGDIIPATTAGRWITVASILAAIIVIPRQASRIVREWTTREKVTVACPECGLASHDRDASHCKACGHVIYQEYDSRG